MEKIVKKMKKFISTKNLIWDWERNAFLSYSYLFLMIWRYPKFSLPVYGVIISESGKTNGYFNNKTLNKAAKDIFNKVGKSSDFLKKWKNFVFKTGGEVHKFCDKLNKISLRKISNKKLLKLYKEAILKYVNHIDGVGLIRFTNRVFQEEFFKIYQDLKVITLFFSTDKRSFFFKEYEDLLKIAEKIRNKKIERKTIENLLDSHAKKYFYISCGYFNEKSLTVADFKKKLNKILKTKENLKDARKKLKEKNKKRKKLISEIRPSEKIKRLIDFSSTCTYFKDFIRGNLNRLHYFIRLIFKEIARRTDNNWEEIASLIPKELNENLLKEKRKIKKRNIAVLFSDKKGVHLILNKNAQQKIEEIKKIGLLQDIKEIKGISVNPGKIIGRVLLVKKIDNIRGKKDFILVSSMTTPDLVPAAKIAKAIITDEGGITCHAAIVSRELNIPCIIGTKIATKVLKDGQLVEVDANKGIVKILKK